MKTVNRSGRKTANGVALTAIAAAVAAALSAPAQAANYNVSTVAELKNAISEANASLEADTITLAAGTITVNDADLLAADEYSAFPVEGTLIIEGAGIGNSVLQRNGAAGQFRFFHVHADAKLTLRKLEISGGSLDFDVLGFHRVDAKKGGAVENEGELTVESVKFFGNSAALGGAIVGMPGSTLKVSDSIFEANYTTMYSQGDGGAIFNNDGTARIERSTFKNNYTAYKTAKTDTQSDGGAIENSMGLMEIEDSAFISNFSYCGGAIENAMGKLVIKNSTFSDNTGMLHAGAIYGSEPRNNGDDGGYGGGLIEIRNSTLTGNHAGDEGGGGVYADAGIVTLTNSLIAGNDSTQNGPDCGFEPADVGGLAQYRQNNDYPGMILVAETNLIGNLTACNVKALNGTHALVIHGADIADLDPLSDNNTPGNAHFLLQATSLAIGQGQNCESKDQLGNARPGNCDLGAIEDQNAASPLVGDEFKMIITGDYVIPAFYTPSESSGGDTSSNSNNTSPAVVESAGASGASSESSGGGGSLDLLGLTLLGLPLLRKFRKKS